MTSTQTPAAGLTTRPAAGTKRGTPEHGTLSCGKYHKCQRPECREAVRAYRRRVHRLQGYGQWQPLVDAEPARAHLQHLNAQGFSYQVIADHLGRYLAAVTGIVYELNPGRGRKRRIRAEFSQAILAITPDDLTPGLLQAAGTARRICALNAIGWPTRIIADRLGVACPRVREVTRQQHVTHATASAVADCYEDLKDRNPLEHGIAPGTVLKLQRLAARKGWRDPLWWEDMGGIDDPLFDPAEADQGLKRNEEAAVRRAEIEHLSSFGMNYEQIAARLGMQPGSVRDIVRELRTGQRRDRQGAAA
ncbi:hypothetical protein [Streptomyces sp. NPDC046332]|uniref:hypothetical protein n=1 Tax=unclassified Streptomyces TaxID=2593676 RepID=UPI0034088097